MKDVKFRFDPDLQNYKIDFTDRFKEIALRVATMEAEFEEKLIKARLIELGWTPPEGNQPPEDPPLNDKSD